MPKLVYALLCQDVIVDRDSGGSCFIKTVEHAVLKEFPSNLPALFVGTLWEVQPDEPFTVALQHASPEGTLATLGLQEVTPTGAMMHKLSFQLSGVKVESEGRHAIVVAVKKGDEWEPCSEIPLHIFKAPQGTGNTGN